MDFLNLFKNLLPDGRAWRLTIDKKLRQFFGGLTGTPEDVKAHADQVFEDVFPETTTKLGEWDGQFGLPDTVLTDAERRDRLTATWRQLVGGQSPRYIQDTLQAAGFDVYVHQFWEPIPGRPNGGSINGDVVPTVRDPRTYINDGTSGTTDFLMNDGAELAQDGGAEAEDGSTESPPGYLLVNKVTVTSQFSGVQDGGSDMQDGPFFAQDGKQVVGFSEKTYTIPNDPDTWPYFLYIGGDNFPDVATVGQARRAEFEELCLRICPTQQWLGVLVQYN